MIYTMDVNTNFYLLKALSQGDEKAYDAVFLDYFPKMKRFIRGFVARDEDAENITQDIFMTLWMRRECLADVADLNSYLYVMAKNASLHYLQESMKKESVSIDDTFDVSEKDNFEDILLTEELNKLIMEAVYKMPEQRKKIFLMSRVEELSNDEIACRLNISKRTVETHISAALAELRKILPLIILTLFYRL